MTAQQRTEMRKNYAWLREESIEARLRKFIEYLQNRVDDMGGYVDAAGETAGDSATTLEETPVGSLLWTKAMLHDEEHIVLFLQDILGFPDDLEVQR